MNQQKIYIIYALILFSGITPPTTAMVDHTLRLGDSILNTSYFTLKVTPATKVDAHKELEKLGLVPLSNFVHIWHDRNVTCYRIADKAGQPLRMSMPIIFPDNCKPYYRVGSLIHCADIVTVHTPENKEYQPHGSGWHEVALLYIQTSQQDDSKRYILADDAWVSASGFDALKFRKKRY